MSGRRRGDLPPGYVEVVFAGRGDAVALDGVAGVLADVITEAGTLYAYAERHPARRAFQGRAPTYAVPLPRGAGEVVVRHAWHGGLLRGLTRDLYRPPTRAPGELRVSEWLRAAGVRTPRVVAFARYPAPLGLCRADVATALVPGGRDLAAVLAPDAGNADDRAAGDGDAAASVLRAGWVDATAELLAALARAGARHPDLNLKNVLLAPDPDGSTRAWALDVDVVRVATRAPGVPDDAAAYRTNVERLARSFDKWRRTRGLRVGVDELNALFARVAELLHPGPRRALLVLPPV